MASGEVIVLIIVLVVILVTVIIIAGVRIAFFQRSTQIDTDLELGRINYGCEENSCSEGLICDPEMRQCKLADGDECTNRYDCLTQSYCNEVCIPRTTASQAITGITGDPCPCNYNTHSCIQGRCLSLGACSVNEDCVTGICTSGTCAQLLLNGTPCNDNIECASGNCSEGLCQLRGVETGQIGSSCLDDNTCNGVLICSNSTCRIP